MLTVTACTKTVRLRHYESGRSRLTIRMLDSPYRSPLG